MKVLYSMDEEHRTETAATIFKVTGIEFVEISPKEFDSKINKANEPEASKIVSDILRKGQTDAKKNSSNYFNASKSPSRS
jgi:hypothetical protein